MPAKNKVRVRGATAPIHAVKSLVLHDVTPPTASAHAASRRRVSAMPAADGSGKPTRVRAPRAVPSC